MGQIVVVTTPDLAPGFRLAGVETHAIDTVEKAEELLLRLLVGDQASLIVVRRGLLQGISARLQRQIETSYRPVVMVIPGGIPTHPGEERRQYITELIRRAIGFHITFDDEHMQAENE